MQTRELCSGSMLQERAAGASSLVCTGLKLVSLRKLAPSRNIVFNQTGMDFVTEISFCIKTPVVHEKGWFLEVGVSWENHLRYLYKQRRLYSVEHTVIIFDYY